MIIQIIDQYLLYLILKKSLKTSCIKKLSNFLDISNLIYSLPLRFRQEHSTTHALLIIITESIRQDLDEGSFGYVIFLDMQKAFDTADHIILLYKLDYYEIRGVCYVMSGSSGFK